MRTKFKLREGGNQAFVTITADNPFKGELDYPSLEEIKVIEWEFNIPINGGYVRRENGNQVCERLGGRGTTLWAESGEDLLSVIKSEWRKYCADAKADFLR